MLLVFGKLKKDDPTKIKWKKWSLSSIFHLLFKLFPLAAVLLQVTTWVCIRSRRYRPLMSTSSPADLFTIFLGLRWGRSYFIVEASKFWIYPNTSVFQVIWDHENNPLHEWSLPPRKTELLSAYKHFVFPCIPVPSSSHWRCSIKKDVLKISKMSEKNTCVGVSL